MRLYLDEDIASRVLVRALTKAAHDVAIPLDAELMSESDAVQLTHAIQDDRVCLTANYRDFEQLHDLVIYSGDSHPGVFAIRGDDDRRRDMKPGHIVTAINYVTTILASVRDHFICLNEWR